MKIIPFEEKKLKPGIELAFEIEIEDQRYIAAFTNRLNGFSSGNFSSLNLSPYVGDDAENVRKNRKYVGEFFGTEDFITVEQVHSTNLLEIEDCSIKLGHLQVKADGILTCCTGLPIGVLTADCIPFLLATDNGWAASVHAGWRGLFQGILEKAIKILKEKGANEIVVIAGPAICVNCYEVGKDLAEIAENKFPGSVQYIENKPHLNLKFIGREIVKSLGINEANFIDIEDCTYCLKDTYFSYRASKLTGRQAGIIFKTRI